MRHPTPAGPAEQGAIDGLEYTLWLPERPPEGGVVVLHGAGSTKENHHDMARAGLSRRLVALDLPRNVRQNIGVLVGQVEPLGGVVPQVEQQQIGRAHV